MHLHQLSQRASSSGYPESALRPVPSPAESGSPASSSPGLLPHVNRAPQRLGVPAQNAWSREARAVLSKLVGGLTKDGKKATASRIVLDAMQVGTG